MIQNVVVFRIPPIEHTPDLGEYIAFITPYCLDIYFNIIVPSPSGSYKWSPCLKFCDWNFVSIFNL